MCETFGIMSVDWMHPFLSRPGGADGDLRGTEPMYSDNFNIERPCCCSISTHLTALCLPGWKSLEGPSAMLRGDSMWRRRHKMFRPSWKEAAPGHKRFIPADELWPFSKASTTVKLSLRVNLVVWVRRRTRATIPSLRFMCWLGSFQARAQSNLYFLGFNNFGETGGTNAGKSRSALDLRDVRNWVLIALVLSQSPSDIKAWSHCP